ncbi:helix-turn-helix transcriptional regulator [Planctomycetales bacterium ZRK34]|nr:helix-turn-helix transcriptional regulator [Planctomycetales bacterium ZRK34]
MIFSMESRLLQAIIETIPSDDRSLRAIADEAGVNVSALSRLVAGERGLSIEAAEAVAGVLGIRFTIRIPKRK